MRNYTGLAVWGCLFACLALEFIDFGGEGMAALESKEVSLSKEADLQGSRLPQTAGSNPRRPYSGEHAAPAEQASAR